MKKWNSDCHCRLNDLRNYNATDQHFFLYSVPCYWLRSLRVKNSAYWNYTTHQKWWQIVYHPYGVWTALAAKMHKHFFKNYFTFLMPSSQPTNVNKKVTIGTITTTSTTTTITKQYMYSPTCIQEQCLCRKCSFYSKFYDNITQAFSVQLNLEKL